MSGSSRTVGIKYVVISHLSGNYRRTGMENTLTRGGSYRTVDVKYIVISHLNGSYRTVGIKYTLTLVVAHVR